jgi:hypothetical protein
MIEQRFHCVFLARGPIAQSLQEFSREGRHILSVGIPTTVGGSILVGRAHRGNDSYSKLQLRRDGVETSDPTVSPTPISDIN